MTNYYGFETTDDVTFDPQGLPVGLHKVMIVGEDAYEKDGVVKGVVVEYEVVEGGARGKSAKSWYLTMHENPQTANIAKQNIKRIAEATGRAVTPSSPLKNRVLKVLVGLQKKDESRTEIKKYFPADYVDSSAPF